MNEKAQNAVYGPAGLSALALIRTSFHHTRPLHRPSR